MSGRSGGQHFKRDDSGTRRSIRDPSTRRRESGPPRRRRVARLGTLAAAAVVVALVAVVLVRAATLSLPAPTARVTAAFPTTVDGPPASVALPASGQAEVTTAGGVVLARSGPRQPQPLASITKVMTAYLILRDHPLTAGQPGPEITVTDAEAATLAQRESEGQSLIPLTAGEQLTELQALEALLIPSADNVADVLADYDAGSVSAFVAKMNTTARALGMTHTTYTGASGYDADTVSTASDQLVLARRAMAEPVLAAIVAMPSVVLPGTGKVSNYNTLVGTDGFTGIKTGSTNAAGGCLLWSVTRPVGARPVTLYGIVLGQRSGGYISAALAAARAATDSAYSALSLHTVERAGTTVVEIDRAGRHVAAETTTALATVDPAGTPVHFSVHTGTPSGATVPVTVTMTTPDGTASTPVRQTAPLAAPTFGWRLAHAL